MLLTNDCLLYYSLYFCIILLIVTNYDDYFSVITELEMIISE